MVRPVPSIKLRDDNGNFYVSLRLDFRAVDRLSVAG